MKESFEMILYTHRFEYIKSLKIKCIPIDSAD